MKCSFKNLFVLGMLIIQRVGLKTPTVLVFFTSIKGYVALFVYVSPFSNTIRIIVQMKKLYIINLDK